MNVSRLPKDTGPAGWSKILDPDPEFAPLENQTTADWLVIGAGFAGLAAARRLAQTHPGDRITVLDAVRIGDGPVGRNSGFMIDLPHVLTSGDYRGDDKTEADDIWANRLAIDFALEAARAYGLPEAAIAVKGKINGAATQKGQSHNRTYAAHLAALGEDHRVLDAGQMRAITGSDYYLGGLYTPGTAMLQPALFARGLARGLTSNRVQIHDKSPVQSLTRDSGTWIAKTPLGQVSAPKVILAVNGHVQSFGAFQGRLMHVMLYASMTRALTPAETRTLGGDATWGITPSDPMGTTVRRISGAGGDRIIIRNRCTFAPTLSLAKDDIGAIARDHDRSFHARFPMLAHVDMEYRWAGRLCLSRNDTAAFGEIEPGLYAACCQNGLGAAKGTFSGMAAADLASGLDSAIARHQLAKPAPRRTMPAALMQIGAPPTIRWRELRAGREM